MLYFSNLKYYIIFTDDYPVIDANYCKFNTPIIIIDKRTKQICKNYIVKFKTIKKLTCTILFEEGNKKLFLIGQNCKYYGYEQFTAKKCDYDITYKNNSV